MSATCIKCGEEFSEARRALGIDICLMCGEQEAQREKERKSKCIAPLFNKGPYQYITSAEQTKWLGKK